MGSAIPPELEELAATYGVMTVFEDAFKRRRETPVETVLSVLSSLGVDVPSLAAVPEALEAERLGRLQRRIEPVLVAWDGEPVAFELTLPAAEAEAAVRATVALEHDDQAPRLLELDVGVPRPSRCGRFATRGARFQHRLPWGYHQLWIEVAGSASQSLLIAAPLRAYSGDAASGRQWGSFLPLYAVRSERNWGAGDLTDLKQLMEWNASIGAQLVGTLPLLAGFLDEPCDPSPYSPVSRVAWNEFYLDVTKVPEFAGSRDANAVVQSPAFASQLRERRQQPHVDYRGLMRSKRSVLEVLADEFFQNQNPTRHAEFAQFLREHPHVEDYAEFRAAHERRREAWKHWPARMRQRPLADSDYDLRSKQYHLYAQWVTTAQLDDLAAAAGGGLYLDLPLGVRPDGYDVWRWNDVYADTASAGSPPEIMWTSGQDWGFPPLHPIKIREQGYRHVRDYLAHHLRLSRMLRIDHVMQLHRLYWIPHGTPKDRGTYVRYRADELYAILNLESHRSQAALVGENLGTVPPEVNDSMARHDLKRMYVAQYEIASEEPSSKASGQGAAALREVPDRALACLNTHDMPTFAAWWRGTDIGLRQQLGLVNDQDAVTERDNLEATKASLTTWLQETGWLQGSAPQELDVLQAFLRFVAASDADAVLINLEDLWLETKPQNVPGTGSEQPNWTRKAARTFGQFARDPQLLEILHDVQRRRTSAL